MGIGENKRPTENKGREKKKKQKRTETTSTKGCNGGQQE